MSHFLIYLQLEPYLRDWFVRRHGGNEPVRLIRGSIESKRLKLLLDTPPKDYIPQRPTAGELSVIVPAYPGKDYRYYNYLSPSSQTAMVRTIRDIFDMELHDFYSKSYAKGARVDYMIDAWMEMKGIAYNDTNYNAVKKRLDRIRNMVRCCRYREKKKQT